MPRSRSTTKARKARQKADRIAGRAAKPEPNHPPKTVTRPARALLAALLKAR